MRVPRVIANLEPTDRVGFITPNAVSTGQARFAEQLRSEIRLALGGIDDLITNVTATEYKSAYGRVSATARKVLTAVHLWHQRCLELIIFKKNRFSVSPWLTRAGLSTPFT